jgi:hypothetical protein
VEITKITSNAKSYCHHKRLFRWSVHAKRIGDGDDASDRSSELPIFVLCDRCYWCATYFDKTRITVGQSCPQCNNTAELTSFPIMSNESFTFDYSVKRGVELEFGSKRKGS